MESVGSGGHVVNNDIKLLHEAREQFGKVGALLGSEGTHQSADDPTTTAIDVLVLHAALVGDAHHYDSSVIKVGTTFGQAIFDESLHRTGGS